MPFKPVFEYEGSRLLSFKQFFSKKEAEALFEFLEKLPVEAEIIRGHEAKRRTTSFGEFVSSPGKTMEYYYSNKVQTANPWPTKIKELLDRIWSEYCKFCVKENGNAPPDNQKPNYCLVNNYIDSTSGIGAHSDSLRGLVPDSSIFSFSVGAARIFELAPRPAPGKPLDGFETCFTTLIEQGELVIMKGTDFQKKLLHRVPPGRKKEGAQEGRRINLTFRAIVDPNAPRQPHHKNMTNEQTNKKPLQASPYFKKRARADDDAERTTEVVKSVAAAGPLDRWFKKQKQ